MRNIFLALLVFIIFTYYFYVQQVETSQATAQFPAVASSKSTTKMTFREASKTNGIDHIFSPFSIKELLSKDTSPEEIYDHLKLNAHLPMTGGIAVGYANQDELPDIFLLGGINGEDELYLNTADDGFNKALLKSNISTLGQATNGAAFADITGDGLDDLFIGGIVHWIEDNFNEGSRTKALFSVWKNLGNGQFADITTKTGLDFRRNTFSAAFSDFDKDGDLDLAIGHWQRLLNAKEDEHIWINNGAGKFSSISSTEKNIFSHWPEVDWTFTPTFSDINNDGWQDLLFASDFETSMVFTSRYGEWFANTTDPTVITDENGMGSALGDFNNDGHFDWFVSSVYDPQQTQNSVHYNWGSSGNRLYKNKGNGTFIDVTSEAGIRDGGWGWGSCMADFNLDGFLDIFHVNGFLYSEYAESEQISHKFSNENLRFHDDYPRLFINQQNGSFIDRAVDAGFHKNRGRAISCTDFDRDGDIDILIQQLNRPVLYYLNDASQETANNFIGVKLKGRKGNPHAAGSKITLHTKNGTQVREIRIGSNYLSQNAPEALFGLGDESEILKITILWEGSNPRFKQDIYPKSINQWLVIEQP